MAFRSIKIFLAAIGIFAILFLLLSLFSLQTPAQAAITSNLPDYQHNLTNIAGGGPAAMHGLDYVGAAAVGAPLIIGTGSTDGIANNDAYQVDIISRDSSIIFSDVPVWGAAFDVQNDRILFTSSITEPTAVDGAQLFEWPIQGGAPTFLGAITDGASELGIDGLAMVNGTLYGVNQVFGVSSGVYQIDLATLVATRIIFLPDYQISGIGADPVTGKLYGLDDQQIYGPANNQGALVEINFTAPFITEIKPYPLSDESDFDGLAIGDNGKAYLVPDDPSDPLIYVYDFNSGIYDDLPLIAPWTGFDQYSGAAFIYSPEIPLYLPLITK